MIYKLMNDLIIATKPEDGVFKVPSLRITNKGTNIWIYCITVGLIQQKPHILPCKRGNQSVMNFFPRDF